MQEHRGPLIPRELKILTKYRKELTTAAEKVAVHLVATEYGNKQRKQETEHPQPGKEDIEESQDQVGSRENPEIVVPVLLHQTTSPISMIAAGHSAAHRPHPMHKSSSTQA